MALRYTTFESMIEIFDSLYWDWERNGCPTKGYIGRSKTVNYTHLLKDSEEICYDEPYISLNDTNSSISLCIEYEQEEGFFSSKSIIEKQRLEDFCKAEGLSCKISEIGPGFLSFSTTPKTDHVMVYGTKDTFLNSTFHKNYLKKDAEIKAQLEQEKKELYTYLKSLIPMVKKIYSLKLVTDLSIWVQHGADCWVYASKFICYYPEHHYPSCIEREYSNWGFSDLKSKDEIHALGLALMCKKANAEPDSLDFDRVSIYNFKNSKAPEESKYGYGLRIPYYYSKIETPQKPPLQNLF